jgi:hypothetical protein
VATFGGEKKALTDNPRFQEGDPFELANNPCFSPNGRRITYTQFGDRRTDLVVMKIDGSDKHAIPGGRGFPNKADWGGSPVGTLLAVPNFSKG